MCSCHNITSTTTNKIHGIIGNLNCSSSNIIYSGKNYLFCKDVNLLHPCELFIVKRLRVTFLQVSLGGYINFVYYYYYVCKCLYWFKQYVGESNSELCIRINGHRYAIKVMFSTLFTSLLEHAQINKDMSEPSLDGYDLILIEQIPITGSYTQDKINRLNQ